MKNLIIKWLGIDSLSENIDILYINSKADKYFIEKFAKYTKKLNKELEEKIDLLDRKIITQDYSEENYIDKVKNLLEEHKKWLNINGLLKVKK